MDRVSSADNDSQLPETQVSMPPANGVSQRTPSLRSSSRASLPAVSRSGDQFTLTPNDAIRYKNEGVLGRGGMGEVRLAHDQDIGRRVAVKRMLDEKSPHAVARFIDEVRTVGQLEHPNIIPIHDVGIDDNGALFFVMKYVEGETLASIIQRLRQGNAGYHRRYTFEARLELFSGLLRALQYAHSKGVIHRDVKPDNILVGQFGEVMLTDWGIARQTLRVGVSDQADVPKTDDLTGRASQSTSDGSIVGTVGYMSPEQAAGHGVEVDRRSDLYCAFTVLYELLTTRPFIARGASSEQMIVSSLERKAPTYFDPDYVVQYQPAIPAELRHFLRRGLQPAKEDRFQDCDEVLSHLARIRSGLPPVQCVGTLIKATNARLDRIVDRHPLLAAFVYAGAGILMLVGIATLGWAVLSP